MRRRKKAEKGKVVSVYLNSFELKSINSLKEARNLCFSDGIKAHFIEQGKRESEPFKEVLGNQEKIISILEEMRRYQPIVNVYPQEQPKRLGFWERIKGKK